MEPESGIEPDAEANRVTVVSCAPTLPRRLLEDAGIEPANFSGRFFIYNERGKSATHREKSRPLNKRKDRIQLGFLNGRKNKEQRIYLPLTQGF